MGGSELQRWRARHRAEQHHPFATELVEYGDHVVDRALNQTALDRRDRIR
jgi:hypothetical protein